MSNPHATAQCGRLTPLAAFKEPLSARDEESARTVQMLNRWALDKPRAFAGVVIDSEGHVQLVGSPTDRFVYAALMRRAADAAQELAYGAVEAQYGVQDDSPVDGEKPL